MAEKIFQDLVEDERNAFEDHISGEYSSEKRERWVEARDEVVSEFRSLVGGDRDQGK